MGDPGFLAHGRIDPTTAAPHDGSGIGDAARRGRPARSPPCSATTCRPRRSADRRPARRDALARQRELRKTGRVRNAGETVDRELIAIVGMAGRFPGAAERRRRSGPISATASNRSGRSRTPSSGRPAPTPSEPGFVNAGSVMDGIDQFDAAFFGMSRREAELTDPQHRVLPRDRLDGPRARRLRPGGLRRPDRRLRRRGPEHVLPEQRDRPPGPAGPGRRLPAAPGDRARVRDHPRGLQARPRRARRSA